MPPRLSLQAAVAATPCFSSTTIPTFLLPFLHTQSRSASILAELSDAPEAYSRKIRRGRGPSSGKGKTSGRGHKGQGQHSKVPTNFKGGQTTEEVVHGHGGFKNIHHIEMSPINLDTLQTWIDAGRLNPSLPITLKELTATRAIHGIKDGVKLLARGSSTLKTQIHLVVSRASASAIAAVEALGGTVTTRYYTPQSIARIKQSKMSPYISLKWDQAALANPVLAVPGAEDPQMRVGGMGYEYRLPDPSGRKEIEYYRDPAHRGYLAHTVKEGEGPSLYFKPKAEVDERKKRESAASRAKKRTGEDNRLW